MRHRKVKRILIVIITLMVMNISLEEDTLAISENKSMSFERITIEQGLSQASVSSLFQDSKGYIWMGTADGLNKFNGRKIEVYRDKQDSQNTIIGNYISTINEDYSGNVWIGTSKGLNKIDLASNKITNYFPKENNCKLSHYNITEIMKGSDGSMYIATVDGVNKYDEKNDQFERILYSEESDKSLSSQFVYTMTEDIFGNTWVGTKNGLNKVDSNGNITKYYNDVNYENSISSNDIYKLYSDKEGYLWIGTNGGGLNRLDIKTGKIRRFTNDSSDNKTISGNCINYIIEDRLGDLWIGTNNGLCKYKKKKDEFLTFRSKIYDNKSLVNNDVLSLYQDNSGMIWVGTYSGISLFNPENTFINYKHDPFDTNSLSANSIAGIYEDDDELLWVGTTHNGVNIIDRKNNDITRIRYNEEDENSISNDSIRAITGTKNEIWIATNNGLNKYDKNTKKFTRFYANDNKLGLVSNDVTSLFVDNEGILWIGTREGLSTFDRNNNLENYTSLLHKNGLMDTYISDIHQDRDGYIWLASGTDGGITKYDKKTGLIKNYKNDFDNVNSISSNSVKSIGEDSLGHLWIATHYGINRLDKKTEKFDRYTETDGLANNFTYGILIDENDNLWISTNYGISKFDIKQNKFINFDITDGIRGNEFNGYAFYKNRDGDMFFGGIDGLTSFNPSDIEDEMFVSKVNIDSAYSNGEKVYISPQINLGYKNNQFEATFFMPDYRNISKIQYAYKLEGFDEEWVFAENRNYANYTNLEPGGYTFLVKARNARGEWSDEEKLKISISNPPWKTPIAYFIYGMVIISSIYIIWNRVTILDSLVKQRTNELNKNLKEKETLYAKLIKNEKYKNNYFVNLSHELRTPLNVIISIQQLIKELNKSEDNIAKGKINYYMDTLERNSNRLLKLINNIIDTSKIESGAYKLEIKDVDIVYLVEDAVLSMRDYIESNGVELIVDPQMEEKVIKCDENEIEKCIINLVANATKFTLEGGKIEVKIFDLGEYVEISVSDTGIGIDKKYHEAIFNRFGQAYNEISEEHGGSGLGLTLTNQIVKLHGGEIKVKSEIDKGSIFTIILPI